jgi:predicted permease
MRKDAFPMIDILNLAVPYFGLIFIGFACGKAKGLPEQGLAWMNFFLLYVSLPALLFGIMSKTPFAELNNPPFLIATSLGTMSAFVLAMIAGRMIGGLSLREATLAGLSGSYGNIGYFAEVIENIEARWNVGRVLRPIFQRLSSFRSHALALSWRRAMRAAATRLLASKVSFR